MKKLITLSIIGITLLVTFSMQNSFAQEVQSTSSAPSSYDKPLMFKAGDANAATKLCLAAVQNNLSKTQLYVKKLSLSYGLPKSGAKVQFISSEIKCNDQNLVDFTASFNAPTTFAYFNSKAAMKYRISPAEVKIIDLARAEKLGHQNGPQVIIITSK
ncbi:hypothetical protein AADZ86_01420 [Colwelliaceae bacterium BS250]